MTQDDKKLTDYDKVSGILNKVNFSRGVGRLKTIYGKTSSQVLWQCHKQGWAY